MAIAANQAEQLVLDFFAVLSSGDLERLRGFFHEASVWEPRVKELPGAGRHVGMAIIDEFLAPVRGLFAPGDPKVQVRAMFSQMAGGKAWVCVESNSTGTSPEGKRYDNEYCWVFEIADGRIDAMREYMDSLYTARWFGLV